MRGSESQVPSDEPAVLNVGISSITLEDTRKSTVTQARGWVTIVASEQLLYF